MLAPSNASSTEKVWNLASIGTSDLDSTILQQFCHADVTKPPQKPVSVDEEGNFEFAAATPLADEIMFTLANAPEKCVVSFGRSHHQGVTQPEKGARALAVDHCVPMFQQSGAFTDSEVQLALAVRAATARARAELVVADRT